MTAPRWAVIRVSARGCAASGAGCAAACTSWQVAVSALHIHQETKGSMDGIHRTLSSTACYTSLYVCLRCRGTKSVRGGAYTAESDASMSRCLRRARAPLSCRVGRGRARLGCGWAGSWWGCAAGGRNARACTLARYDTFCERVERDGERQTHSTQQGKRSVPLLGGRRAGVRCWVFSLKRRHMAWTTMRAAVVRWLLSSSFCDAMLDV